MSHNFYIPKAFCCESVDEAFALMRAYPFATVLSVLEENGKPSTFVSHVPVTAVRDRAGELTLIGHLARTNPHASAIDMSECLVIFQGPNTYISPTWYSVKDVPTWNYLVVHAKGTAKAFRDNESISTCLQQLTEHVRDNGLDDWSFWLPTDLVGNNLQRALVGFEVRVQELQFKKKLSQNRSLADQRAVIQALARRGDDHSRGIRKSMADNLR